MSWQDAPRWEIADSGDAPIYDVVVVGAGPAGLACAAALTAEEGLNVLLLEGGEQPGQSWAGRYEGLRLNTTRYLSGLPGRRIPRRLGRFPAREDYLGYLHAYAADTRCHTAFGTHAERLEPLGPLWRVCLDGGQVMARAVVVATGHDRVPVMPDWQGLDSFRGDVLHAADFRRASDFTGASVLVTGTGNSGCEIAALIAAEGQGRVWLSRRSAPLLVPETILGISLTAWGLLLQRLPDRAVDAAGRAANWLLYRDLANFGFPPPRARLSTMRHRYYSPPVDRGIAKALRAGSVRVVEAVHAFDGDEVHLADGTYLRPDVVITATGYRPGLESLVGHLDVLDDRGRPRVDDRQEAPGHPGLFFAGWTYGLLALLPYIAQEARTIAEAVVSDRRPGIVAEAAGALPSRPQSRYT